MTGESPPSPYKFLDPYGTEDRELFFGRERETRILLADVIVSRLVVLFARTGTGKTSLINAGVRPELESRGYSTFVVRVEQDPAESARRELLTDPRITTLTGSTFPRQIEGVVTRLGQPIVIFFDQFEEFFVYLMSRKESRDRGRQFIRDVGELHGDKRSGVHLVFSMREDFMAAMDDFRDEIPSIFHQDSNLRLRWFDDDQARAAIGGPARARGVPIEPRLVERVIDDLRDEEGIEPAQIQIICDTLWRHAGDGGITVEHYEALGAGSHRGTIAVRILKRRLEEECAKIEHRPQLELLSRLLPVLRTPQGTKYIRDLPSLVRELGADESLVRATLTELEERSRLTRMYVRDGLTYVELTHDYLVSHLDDLSASVGVIWPRRVLARAMAAGAGDERYREDVEDVLERVRAEQHRARESGRPALGDIELTRAEGAFLLRFALVTGMQPSVADDVFRLATDLGAPAADVVRDALAGDSAEAEAAVELASRLGPSLAPALLRPVIARGDALATHAIEALGRCEEAHAVDLLTDALRAAALSPGPELALSALAASRRNPAVAERAAAAVVAYLQAHLEAGVAARSIAGLGRVAHPLAVDALEQLLEDPESAGEARTALLQLAQSVSPAAANRARDALLDDVVRSLPHVSGELIEALGSLDDAGAVGALMAALRHPPLQASAERALARLHRSSRPEVVAAVQRVIERARPATLPEPAPRPALAVEWRPPPVGAGPLDSHFSSVADRLLDGRVIPFLGPGVNMAGRPPGDAWQLGRSLPSGRELAEHLAHTFAYPRSESADLLQVAQYAALEIGRQPLEAELREALTADVAPTPLHSLLAGLPAKRRLRDTGGPPLLIVTMNFDDALERAFAAYGEEVDVLRYQAFGEDAGRWLHLPAREAPRIVLDPMQYELATEATVILKPQGGIDREDPQRQSFVITEDDYLDFATGDDLSTSVPVTIVARLRRSYFLFVGASLRDWNARLLLRQLWSPGRNRYKSWAVAHHVDTIEERLWSQLGVEIIESPLAEYAEQLARHVEPGEARV